MSKFNDRPKCNTLRSLRSLFPFLNSYSRVFAAAVASLVVASAAMLTLPLALQRLIDNGISAKNANAIEWYFVELMSAVVAVGTFSALRFYLVTWIGERLVADLRLAVFRRMVRMDSLFFETTRVGEVLSRLTADVVSVRSLAGENLFTLLNSTSGLVGALICLGLTNAKLTGILLLLVPVVFVPLTALGRRVRALSRASQDRVAESVTVAGETLNAIQTVQAFTLEELQNKKYGKAVEDAFTTAVRRTGVHAELTAFCFIMVFGSIAFVLWLGARDVLAGIMTGGQLAQFMLFAGFVGNSTAQLSTTWLEIQRSAGAAERLLELLHATPAVTSGSPGVEFVRRARGSVRFDNVSFHFPSRRRNAALSNFRLEINPGETIAFVGPSGAGKSTTFQLLLRFYDPSVGQVQIDGVRLANVNPEDLRRQIGFVPQETVLFGASARENIRYGCPDASDAQIEAAAIAAEADGFLRNLPNGYDTFLGERGTSLSGGERQRIALARVILKDAPILLLDEATSSLDAESERLVQSALERLMRGRTTILIAHRLVTALKADRIVVLDHGIMMAVGKHDELLSMSPLYARMVALQFGAADLVSSDLVGLRRNARTS